MKLLWSKERDTAYNQLGEVQKVIPDHVIEKNKWIVEQFIVRARKIQSTELGKSLSTLEDLTKIDRKVLVKSDGSVSWSIPNVPNESDVESLAIYARTMTLQDDPIHFTASAKAVKTLLKKNGNDDEISLIDSLISSWVKNISQPKETWTIKEKASAEENLPLTEVTNIDLAWGWIYGETFHHGEKSVNSLSNFDINSMFESAYPLIADISIHAIKLLELIRNFQKLGKIEVDSKSFDKEVRYNPNHLESIISTVVYTGPVGSKPPEINATEEEIKASGFEKLTLFTHMSQPEINEYLQKRSEEFRILKVNSTLESVVFGKDFSDCFIAAINKIVVEEVEDLHIAAKLFREFGLGIESDVNMNVFRIKGSTEVNMPFNIFSALLKPLAIFFDGDVTVDLQHESTGALISKTFNSESAKRVRDYHGLNSEDSLGNQFRKFYGIS